MKQRATIILVFALFLAPVLLATLMHSRWWHFEPQTKNYGELVEPVIALESFQVTDSSGRRWDQESLRDHWTLLAVNDGVCEKSCVERLTWLARLRETQGRHLQRLNVMVVGTRLGEVELPPLQDGIVLAATSDQTDEPMKPAQQARNQAWTQQLPHAANLNTTYLIDPVGNIIMSYPADSDPTGIRKDLKRILTWSKADTA